MARRGVWATIEQLQRFASGATTIEFSPSSDTITTAVPDDGSSPCTAPTSTPACRRASTTRVPSAPVRPHMRTAAPQRAAATAWLAPLPPGCTANDRASTVWPARGNAATRMTRSTTREPTTWIRDAMRGA